MVKNKWFIKSFITLTTTSFQMGLIVMLDAHTDILTEHSVATDFEGFTAIVTPATDFPLMYQVSKIQFTDDWHVFTFKLRINHISEAYRILKCVLIVHKTVSSKVYKH